MSLNFFSFLSCSSYSSPSLYFLFIFSFFFFFHSSPSYHFPHYYHIFPSFPFSPTSPCFSFFTSLFYQRKVLNGLFLTTQVEVLAMLNAISGIYATTMNMEFQSTTIQVMTSYSNAGVASNGWQGVILLFYSLLFSFLIFFFFLALLPHYPLRCCSLLFFLVISVFINISTLSRIIIVHHSALLGPGFNQQPCASVNDKLNSFSYWRGSTAASDTNSKLFQLLTNCYVPVPGGGAITVGLAWTGTVCTTTGRLNGGVG